MSERFCKKRIVFELDLEAGLYLVGKENLMRGTTLNSVGQSAWPRVFKSRAQGWVRVTHCE